MIPMIQTQQYPLIPLPLLVLSSMQTVAAQLTLKKGIQYYLNQMGRTVVLLLMEKQKQLNGSNMKTSAANFTISLLKKTGSS